MKTLEREPQRPRARMTERQEGLIFAREWRERNKPLFDAMYGATCCGRCGSGK
jgi:hypothetical protein